VLRNQILNEARPNVTKLVVLLTDAKTNQFPYKAIIEANRTKAENVEVFVVGVDDVRTTQVLFRYFHTMTHH